MSGWEAYNAQIQECDADDGGGIFSVDDGTPWCSYGSLSEDKEVVKSILECCKSGDTTKAPVKIKGQKQMVVRADKDELIAKNGTKSQVVAKINKQCVVIGVSGEGKDLRFLNNRISKLGDYLKDSGY